MAVKGYTQHLANLQKNKSKLYNSFVQVTDEVASASVNLKTITDKSGRLKLSAKSNAKFDGALNKAAEKIKKATDKIIRTDIFTSVDVTKSPIDDIMINDMGEYLNRRVLTDLALNATRESIESQFKKIYKTADGKTHGYIGSLNGLKKTYAKDIKNLLEAGLREGRDIREISKDISVYAKGGKPAVSKRAPKYANAQISNKIDWKALRLSRTTIQGGVQDGLIIGAETSPSVTGFDWVLSPLHNRYSICEDIVAGNPWTYNDFTYNTPPHPNCLSSVSARNMTRKKFLSDLKKWDGGEGKSIDYLDKWNKTYYEPSEKGQAVKFPKLLDNNKKAAT